MVSDNNRRSKAEVYFDGVGLSEVTAALKSSDDLLKATWCGDSNAIVRIIAFILCNRK